MTAGDSARALAGGPIHFLLASVLQPLSKRGRLNSYSRARISLLVLAARPVADCRFCTVTLAAAANCTRALHTDFYCPTHAAALPIAYHTPAAARAR